MFLNSCCKSSKAIQNILIYVVIIKGKGRLTGLGTINKILDKGIQIEEINCLISEPYCLETGI